MLTGAGHNTIQGTGGGFLGYITAWLMYQLEGGATARQVFVGPRELFQHQLAEPGGEEPDLTTRLRG